jgi:hypothetical protein
MLLGFMVLKVSKCTATSVRYIYFISTTTCLFSSSNPLTSQCPDSEGKPEEFLLQLANSPRIGSCGFTGAPDDEKVDNYVRFSQSTVTHSLI